MYGDNGFCCVLYGIKVTITVPIIRVVTLTIFNVFVREIQ